MSDAWITLRTFDSQPQAELARVALANAGIDCQLLNAEVVSMDWLLGNAIGYIPLQVPPDQLETAENILGGGLSTELGVAGNCTYCGEPLPADGPCPMCGFDPTTGSEPQTSGAPHDQAGDSDDREAGDHQPTHVSLAGLRSLGRLAISTYLLFLFGWVILTLLAAAAGFALLFFTGVRGF